MLRGVRLHGLADVHVGLVVDLGFALQEVAADRALLDRELRLQVSELLVQLLKLGRARLERVALLFHLHQAIAIGLQFAVGGLHLGLQGFNLAGEARVVLEDEADVDHRDTVLRGVGAMNDRRGLLGLRAWN